MFTKAISVAVPTFLAFLISNVCLVAAFPKISAVGNKFFTDEGKQFYIKGTKILTFPLVFHQHSANSPLKGVAYQLIPEDPLIDTDQCKRDAKQMQDLGANAIRVYHVDPTGDHKGCMKAFEDAGIYLFVDLDDFETQIEQVGLHLTKAGSQRALMDSLDKPLLE